MGLSDRDVRGWEEDDSQLVKMVGLKRGADEDAGSPKVPERPA